MPQRTAGLIVAILGVLALAVLLLVGRGVYRAARTGPRWRRRLVGAGIVLLGTLGLLPADSAVAAKEEAKAAAPADVKATSADLAERAEWKWIVAAWRDAEDVASGRRGDYPFNEGQKKNLLDRVAGAGTRVETLQKEGQLSEAEAGLLKADLRRLGAGVDAKRTIEMREATCYKPMMVVPARDSLKRLEERLPLLEKVAGAKLVNPEVLARVMVAVEDDLATLGNETLTKDLEAADKANAKKVHDAARDAIQRIHAATGASAAKLSDAPEWKVFVDAAAFVQPLAKSGKSTSKEREQAEKQLKAAGAALETLGVKGLLAWPEAELLKAEMQTLRTEVYRNPPTDTKVLCYDMAFLPPARQSMQRLTDRLPLLEKMVERGKIAPEVLARVLPTVEADLATLGDEKLIGQLQKDQQVEARSSLKPRADEILKKAKALVAK